jgi:hypothetical protein
MSSQKPTQSQIDYATRLLKQMGEPLPDFTTLDSKGISELIDGLKKKRGKPVWYGDGQFSHFEPIKPRWATENASLAQHVVDRFVRANYK